MSVSSYCTSFINGCYSFSDELRKVAYNVTNSFVPLRNDPGSYQKIGYIALSSLELMMLNNPVATARFSRVASLLSKAMNVQDCYSAFQYLNSWRFPVTASVIDRENVQKDVLRALSPELIRKNTHEEIKEIKEFIGEATQAFLSQIDKDKTGYHNLEEFKSALKKYFDSKIEKYFKKGEEAPHPELNVESMSTEGWLRQVPFLERILSVNWLLVDSVNIAWWYREWELLSAAEFAANMGQLSVFQVVKDQKLLDWLIGLICTGSALEVVESGRKLFFDKTLSETDKTEMRWKIVINTVSLIYFSVVFTNMIGQTSISLVCVHRLSILARSVGLFKTMVAPSLMKYLFPKNIQPADEERNVG